MQTFFRPLATSTADRPTRTTVFRYYRDYNFVLTVDEETTTVWITFSSRRLCRFVVSVVCLSFLKDHSRHLMLSKFDWLIASYWFRISNSQSRVCSGFVSHFEATESLTETIWYELESTQLTISAFDRQIDYACGRVLSSCILLFILPIVVLVDPRSQACRSR